MSFMGSVGGVINSLTGVSSSARQANRYNTALARLSYAQEKEFAQNAHQWEANDLEKAGLNRALTATGSSAGAVASAGGISNSATAGTSAGLNPLDIVGMYNQTSATKHDNELKDNNGKLAQAQAIAIIQQLPIDIKLKRKLIEKYTAETKYTNERARGHTTSKGVNINIAQKLGGGIGGGFTESETH